MQSEIYPDAFYEGQLAAWRGKESGHCPYSTRSSHPDDSAKVREQSDMCKRHWWIAGWYEGVENAE